MIKHIVMWNLKCSDGDKASLGKEIKAKLEGLKGQIDEIEQIQVGINVNTKDPDARDLCLILETENMESLASYASHEKHQAVLAEIGAYLEDRTVIDIEI